MTKSLAILVTFFVAVPLGAAQDAFQYEKEIEALVQPYLDHEKFFALSIGVVLEGKTWTANYGRMSETDNRQPTADTIYELGSISKVFTSLLLADAASNGNLTLDQPIGTLMPEMNDSNPDVGKSITLKQLAIHTSGLPRMPTNINPADPNNPFAGYDRELLVEFMKTVKPQHRAGKKYEYSNLGGGLLGELVAHHANTGYDQLLREKILEPLKMNDTFVRIPETHRQRMAPPHNAALLPDHNWGFGVLDGAYAVRSTTHDMIRFIQAQIDSPDDAIGNAIDLAWQQQLSATLFGRRAMGLGWVIAGDGLTRWHNGQTGGYQTMMLINRKSKAGVILLCNTASSGVDPLAEGIFQTIVGMKVKPVTFTPTVNVDPEYVQRLVGNYQLAPGVIISVFSNRDKLMAQLTGQGAMRVYPKSESVWNYRDVKAQLRFDVPETGKSTGVSLHQNGRILPAPRIKD